MYNRSKFQINSKDYNGRVAHNFSNRSQERHRKSRHFTRKGCRFKIKYANHCARAMVFIVRRYRYNPIHYSTLSNIA